MIGGVPQRSVKDPLSFFSELLLRQKLVLPLWPLPSLPSLPSLCFPPPPVVSVFLSMLSTFCSGSDQMLPDHMLWICQCGTWTRPNGKQWGSRITESALNSALLLRLLELFFFLLSEESSCCENAAEGGSRIITSFRRVPLHNLYHNCCV